MFRAIMRIMEELERCSPEKVNDSPAEFVVIALIQT